MSIFWRFRKLYPIWRIARGRGVERLQTGKSKPFSARLGDLLSWYLRYGEVLYYYYVFGFESKSRAEQDEYMSWIEADRIREGINAILVNSPHPIHYKILSFDKFVANNYLNYLGITCATNAALICNGQVVWEEGRTVKLDTLFESDLGVMFVKPATGMGGGGIVKADFPNKKLYTNDAVHPIETLKQIVEKDVWVLQKEVVQHPELNRINPHAVNCLRINTVLENHRPVFISSFMKIAAGSAVVDNWDKGSMLVGVDHPAGTLKAEGYYKLKFINQEVVDRHPDTGVVFKGFQLPFYQETVDMCLRAHEYHYGTFMLGWDVAITPEGPVIIEVNCEPTLHAQQMIFGGMRKKLSQIQASYARQR